MQDLKEKVLRKDGEIKDTLWMCIMYAEQQYSFQSTKNENSIEKIKIQFLRPCEGRLGFSIL